MKEIDEAIEYFEKFGENYVSKKLNKTALAALRFVKHIQEHLDVNQQVICKICGKSFNSYLTKGE